MSNNKKHAGFRVNEQALKDAKERCEHGELSEELRRVVQRLAYGAQSTKRDRVQEGLETLREEKREVLVKKQQLQSEERELNRKIERKEEELDSLQDMEAEYAGMLEAIEADLHTGMRIWGSMSKVKNAARKAEKTSAEVMEELKDRNPDVPEMAYRERKADEPAQWKDTTELKSTK